jgi:hypothetical protein
MRATKRNIWTARAVSECCAAANRFLNIERYDAAAGRYGDDTPNSPESLTIELK